MDVYRKLLVLALIPISAMAQTGSINVDQNHNGHKIFGLPTPVAADEAATKAYADSVGGGGGGAAWGSITGTLSAQTDLQGALDAKQALDGDLTAIAALSGTNVIPYRSAANTWGSVTIGSGLTFTSGTLTATGGGGGSGDVVGPSSATDNAIARFDTTTGKLIQNSAVTLDDTGAFAFPAGVRQTFDPNGTTPGLNVGAISGDPNTPSDGDVWYNTGLGLRARVSGANMTVGSGTVTNVANLSTGQLVVGASGSTVNVGNLSGAVTTSGGTATTLANSAVTYAKMQNVSANSVLLGSSATGSGAPPSEIALGTNLSMSGSTLNATGGGGGTIGGSIASPQVAYGSASNTITGDTKFTYATTTGLDVAASNTTVNTVVPALTIRRQETAAGTPAPSFGTGIVFTADDATTANVSIAQIGAEWIDASHTSNSAAGIRFSIYDGVNFLQSKVYMYSQSGGGAGSMSVGFQSDPGSGRINAQSGFRSASTNPASGKFLQSDGGGSYTNSVLTLPTSATTSGTIMQSSGSSTIVMSTPTWPTTAGTSSYSVRSDGTYFAAYPMQIINSSTADDSSFSTTDRYLAGSACTVAAGDFKAGGQYRCIFDMVKSAGTGAIVITVRVGTTGTTSDTTATIPFTFGAGTSVADTGMFEVLVNFRSVGSGTSAVIAGVCRGTHNLATTGLFNNAAAWTIIGTTSAGFNSSTATKIGVSFNGSTTFAGVNKVVQAALQQ